MYASDAAIDSVKRPNGHSPGRVLAIALGPNVAPHDPELLYDALMIHRVRNVLGYHGNEIRRYDVLTGRDSGYRQLFTPQLWRLLNVRYVLCDLDSLPLPGVSANSWPDKGRSRLASDLVSPARGQPCGLGHPGVREGARRSDAADDARRAF